MIALVVTSGKFPAPRSNSVSLPGRIDSEQKGLKKGGYGDCFYRKALGSIASLFTQTSYSGFFQTIDHQKASANCTKLVEQNAPGKYKMPVVTQYVTAGIFLR